MRRSRTFALSKSEFDRRLAHVEEQAESYIE